MNQARKDALRFCGNEEQLNGWRLCTVTEGSAAGARLLTLWNAAGLEMELWPDNGLDVGRTRARGVNCCYVTKNGFTSPYRTLALQGEFDHSFCGGMLYTCGLLNVGPENTDSDGVFHPLHGRIHGQSCSGLSVKKTDCALVVEGVLRETVQWGHSLELCRTITVPFDTMTLQIDDRITNLTGQTAELMVLYHLNFGYPFLRPDTRILWGRHRVSPRNEWAEEHAVTQHLFEEPQALIDERVYFNEAFDDPTVEVVTPSMGLKARLTWTQDTLPRLSQWKTTREGEYCLALEPSTCYTAGRAAERAGGTLVLLEGWGERRHGVSVTFEEVK